ncbi:MAG: hypothetical protein CYG59_12095, partial [Chloroflexi bacterium]
AVRLVDLLGSGISGILWSADANGRSRANMFFLDLTAAMKPYVLNEMDNHMGAVTKVEYVPSTRFYLKDHKRPETRWKTPLPFPVQTVARVEVIDQISRGKLTTEYRYHHGYWDGGEREFRGFGMVEQLDTESFADYHATGLHGESDAFAPVGEAHFSPPTLTRTWFHQGPVGDEFGEWDELDYRGEYWAGDPSAFGRHDSVAKVLGNLEKRRDRRDALRALRGSMLRTELYALDDSDREQRPYTVTESQYGLREEAVPGAHEPGRQRIFFPHLVAQRTTQWERGDDPMTQFTFTDHYDDYGQPERQTQIACPRGWRTLADTPAKPYLATRTRMIYAEPKNRQKYIRDRVAKTTTYELTDTQDQTVLDLRDRPDSTGSRNVISQTVNFYDGGAFVGQPFGTVGDYGALVRTESLVLTEEILKAAYGRLPPYLDPDGTSWTSDYPPEFQATFPTLAGYVYQPGNDVYTQGYFVATDRRRYDFHDPSRQPRGLVIAGRDPLGRETSIEYDKPYHLLPEKVIDPAKLETTAKYDYRTIQPRLVTDGNKNETEFRFSSLGLLKETWVTGNPNKVEGDRQRPSLVMEYDFLAFEKSPLDDRQPIFARAIRHVHHDTETDVALPQRDETIETREYSDGFGRLLQTRAQGEDVRFGDDVFGDGESILPADQRAASTGDVVGRENTDPLQPNVVVSGWQVYDNKGRVVEKYEPFFSTGWEYRTLEEERALHFGEVLGQKVSMFYDPRGQAVRTFNPDGSEQRVIYGMPANLDDPETFVPTPWEVYTYDANDNAGRTHAATATAYRHHWNTPSSAEVDALGRAILTVQRYRAKPAGPTDPLPPIEEHRTVSTYDIRGNVLTVTDALGRRAFAHVYDLANRPLQVESIDAGVRQSVFDAVGSIVEQRDSKGALVLRRYDALNRLTHLWARDAAGESLGLRERLVYGDDPNLNLIPAQLDENNLRGKLYRHYDEAGLVTFAPYDFKGNVLEKARQVIRDAEIVAKFNPPPTSWQIETFRTDWQSSNGTGPADLDVRAATLLDATSYETSLTYDALNRIQAMWYPKDADGARKILRPLYNRAGALERVEMGGTIYVDRITYNAKGQRTLIAYGNQLLTRYAYDDTTSRLVRMRTERYTAVPRLTYKPDGGLLQDFAYDYDLAGNITSITDRVPGSGFINNPESARVQQSDPRLAQLLGAGDALIRHFEYDPL